MEFTGSIQFADESSWLTLTTESDDTVTISVRLNTFVPNQEAADGGLLLVLDGAVG